MKKNGRDTVKFDAVAEDEKPIIIDKNENKSSYSAIWLVLAALGIIAVVFFRRRPRIAFVP